MIYKVTVEKKAVAIVGDKELVRGNVEVDYLEAALDSEWEDMERVLCVFYGGDEPKKMKLEDGRCEVPWESLEGAKQVRLTFIGYDADDPDADRRIVTREMAAAFDVKDHGFMDGEDPAEPTPDVYTDHENRIKALEEGGVDIDMSDYLTVNDFREAHEAINEALDDCLTEIPPQYVTDSELTAKGFQTKAEVTAIVNEALGVIENGSY